MLKPLNATASTTIPFQADLVRIGDEVLVRGRVIDTCAGSLEIRVVSEPDDSPSPLWIDHVAVAAIVEAPLQGGDTALSLIYPGMGTGQVLAVHGSDAWVLWSKGKTPSVESVGNLKRLRATPEPDLLSITA